MLEAVETGAERFTGQEVLDVRDQGLALEVGDRAGLGGGDVGGVTQHEHVRCRLGLQRVLVGRDEDELVAETVIGTAELLAERDPEAIQRAVAPPGGTTEAGLDALSEHSFDDAIAAAVAASLERFR